MSEICSKALGAWLCACALALPLAGQSVSRADADGTTHHYEVVLRSRGVSWLEAQADAVASGGHLVTLDDAAENSFVFSLVDDPRYWVPDGAGGMTGPWIGGVQQPGGVEPLGGWVWVDGATPRFAAWAVGEPSDLVGAEQHTSFASPNAQRAATWGDRNGDTRLAQAYIIEWSGHSPERSFGRFERRAGADDGYTLISPLGGDGVVRLIDADGRLVHEWTNLPPNGYTAELLPDGSLIRSSRISGSSTWNGLFAGGVGGRIQRHAWDGTLLWDFVLDTPTRISHHDFEVLPNGNVLMMAWERKTAAEAVALGRLPALLNDGELWPDALVEVQPTGLTTGSIVWEWKVWDHIVQDVDVTKPNFGVVADSPGRIDINYALGGDADWTHFNAISYDPATERIAVTVAFFDEVWVLDHSTTVAEAATSSGGRWGRGGDILYRWGNPRTYRRGSNGAQVLYGPHNAQWIAPGLSGAGDLLVYNNGRARALGDWSSIEQITPPTDSSGAFLQVSGQPFGPSTPTWSYVAPNPVDFYSRIVSGTQRLPNGNTLVCEGITGTIFEVTPSGERVWRYVSPVVRSGPLSQGGLPPSCAPQTPCNGLFRAARYPQNHPAFSGRDLRPRLPVELLSDQLRSRYGNVSLRNGGRAQVLRMTGREADGEQRIAVSALSTFSLELDAAPDGPATTPYLVFVYVGEPVGVANLPSFLGEAAFQMPILGGPPAPPVWTLFDTSGWPGVGLPLVQTPSTAPTGPIPLSLPAGTWTIQGLILDQGSDAGVAVTNALVLEAY